MVGEASVSLTFGSGPLSESPRRGDLNFPLADVSPKRQLFWQPDERRLRAIIAGVTVFDTTRARLLHETAVVPRAYAPLDDFRRDLLVWSPLTTHCPWKGDASHLSLSGEGIAVDNLVWTYEQPLASAAFLRGYGAVYPDKVDVWLVEEDRVIAELRDPYHRVDVHPSTRLAVATIEGEEVARSARPMLVFKTGVRTRVYFPPIDIAHPSLMRPGSGKRTTCQYKGEASYWTVAGVEDAAWSYDLPLPDALRVQGHLSFDEKHPAVDVTLEGA